MLLIEQTKIKEDHFVSPKGAYEQYFRNLSAALGHKPDSALPLERHPFDVELIRLPPGKKTCPYHAHSAQWEMYIILSGTGHARSPDGLQPVSAGHAFVHPPGNAHQLINDGADDLVFYVIADNPVGEACYYPDSKKWLVPSPPRGSLLKGGEEADYYEGEE